MNSSDISVVVLSHNRPRELGRTLGRLLDLPEKPPIIVVDNNSSFDADALVADVPGSADRIDVIALPDNRGAAARTVGVRHAGTPYVAFSDDDSWWEPGALGRAVHHLDDHPTMGALVAQTLVGERGAPDPLTPQLAGSPLGWLPGLPGPSLLGFLACSVVVRAQAYLQVGGFHPVLWFAGEERLLAMDLVAEGWDICYVDEVQARHWPSAHRPPQSWRLTLERRNELLTTWMRRPLRTCAAVTVRTVARGIVDGNVRRALPAAVRKLPAAMAVRQELPRWVEDRVALLERPSARAPEPLRAPPERDPEHPRATVIMITHNRIDELRTTLEHMTSIPDAMPIILVDNASCDGSADMVERDFPSVRLVRAETNLGAVARNIAVAMADTPYVAFCDDDTTWQPGSLTRAADVLDRYPSIGTVTGKCIVEPSLVEDPLTPELRHSPVIGPRWLPGPALLGIMAGLTMIRVSAFDDVNGFCEKMWLGGEEELLALDLAANGWWMCWIDDVVIHHFPSKSRDSRRRRQLGIRNTLWTLWLRRPLRSALRRSRQVIASAPRDLATVSAVGEALASAPWVVSNRRVLDRRIEDGLRSLEVAQRDSPARRYVDG